MNQPIDSKCRMCYKAEEHLKHIVTGPSVALRSPVGLRATEDHTNEHCTAFVKCWSKLL